MKKSLVSKIALSVAAFSGMLGATLVGAVKVSSKNRVLPVEASVEVQPCDAIKFDSNYTGYNAGTYCSPTAGSGLDGKYTWNTQESGVSYSEATCYEYYSSTGEPKGPWKNLKFVIPAGKTAKILYHNNGEINFGRFGVYLFCSNTLEMSLTESTNTYSNSKDVIGKQTLPKFGTPRDGTYFFDVKINPSSVYCDTATLSFKNNGSSSVNLFILRIFVNYVEYRADFELNGGAFPDSISSNYIVYAKHHLYKRNSTTDNNLITPSTNPISIPLKDGYVFKGFYTEDTFENMFINENGYLTENAASSFDETFKLYAKWAPAGQPVTIAAGTGVSNVFLSTSDNATSGDPSGTSYPEGVTVYGYVDLKPGYIPVAAWHKIEGADTIYRLPTSHVMDDKAYNFSTHAAAGKYTYNITYGLDGGSLEEDNPATYNVETESFTLYNPTKTGYTFLGWTGSNGDTPQTVVTIPLGSVGDKTYNANFSLNEYSITYDLNGGTVSGENPEEYSIESADFSLINPTKNGYTFKGWSGTGLDGDENENVAISHTDIGDKEFTANWILDEYSISYNLNGGTVETANPATYNVETATFTLNNPTKEGYTFLGWSGTDIADKSTSVTVEQGSVGNREYVANWQAMTTNVTLSQQGGSGGTTQITATYGEPMPNISIPTKSDRTFIGYFTAGQEGTKYYNGDGTSAKNWDKTNASTTLYARYIPNLHVNEVTGTNYTWDGEGHSYQSILVQYTDDENVTHTLYDNEYQIRFSNDGGETYTLSEKPTFSSVGTHTIYYEVSADNLASLHGTIEISIGKADSVITKAPVAKSGLKYTGSDLELVVAGEANYGDVIYAVSEIDAVPELDKFSKSIPERKAVGTYYVFYAANGDDNHNPIAPSIDNKVVVTISEVDKEGLSSLITTVDAYLATITEKYPEIASTLKAVRDEAYNDYVVVKDVSEAQITAEIAKLEEALGNAKVDIVELLISNIGTVTFPDSEDAIEEARAAYSALDGKLQAEVENYSTLTAAEATYADLASQRKDETSGVLIQTNDGTRIDENINLRVEIKTSVKAQEGSTEYQNIQSKLAADEVISNVYDIKLVRMDGDVETEIQPSDIKEGMKIIVHIKVPTGLEVNGLKLLHIHSENDISFVENFEITNGEIVFEADHFSEIAFVKKVNAPKPVDPSNNDEMPSWFIFVVILGGVIGLLLIFFLIFAGVRRDKDREEQY